MLRHIGLAAVVVALVTLTADTVHARGGVALWPVEKLQLRQ